MSKKKKKKITLEMIEIRAPLPKKWKLTPGQLGAIYRSACEAWECDYDTRSFMNGLLLGIHIAEDEKVGVRFFDRKEEEE